jgi:hypothetical protein
MTSEPFGSAIGAGHWRGTGGKSTFPSSTMTARGSAAEGPAYREPLPRWVADAASEPDRRRNAVGRPVVIGLGTLILLLIAVAFFF